MGNVSFTLFLVLICGYIFYCWLQLKSLQTDLLIMDNSIAIQERTEKFAIRVVKAYTEINKNNHFNDSVVVISKQFLRSGTSIGANISEGIYAQSNKDFISKYSIAIKEASECRYWINLMVKSNAISEKKMLLLNQEINSIIKILTTIIRKLKAKEK